MVRVKVRISGIDNQRQRRTFIGRIRQILLRKAVGSIITLLRQVEG